MASIRMCKHKRSSWLQFIDPSSSFSQKKQHFTNRFRSSYVSGHLFVEPLWQCSSMTFHMGDFAQLSWLWVGHKLKKMNCWWLKGWTVGQRNFKCNWAPYPPTALIQSLRNRRLAFSIIKLREVSLVFIRRTTLTVQQHDFSFGRFRSALSPIFPYLSDNLLKMTLSYVRNIQSIGKERNVNDASGRRVGDVAFGRNSRNPDHCVKLTLQFCESFGHAVNAHIIRDTLEERKFSTFIVDKKDSTLASKRRLPQAYSKQCS